MKRRKVFATLVVLGIIGLIAGAIVIAQQQITLTSYYPAPYGEYVDLSLGGILTAKERTVPATPSAADQGQIYFDDVDDKFKVSEDGGAWTDLVGGGAWTRDPGPPAIIHPTDLTDRVAIGSVTPTAAKLRLWSDVLGNPFSTLWLENTWQASSVGIAFVNDLPAYPNAAMISKNGTLQIGGCGPSGPCEGSFVIKSSIDGSSPMSLSIGGSAGQFSRIFLATNGNVGIGGMMTPARQLHVNGDGEFSGELWVGGDQMVHPDYVFEPDYHLESIDEHAGYMWQHKHLKAIPRTDVDEKGRGSIKMGETQLGILEELEKAHLYIEQLHKRLKALEEKSAKEVHDETP